MGKGNTSSPTVPRRQYSETGTGGDGRNEAASSPCARTIDIGIELTLAGAVAIHDSIAIGPGQPPVVQANGRLVGVVAAFDAPEIEGCIALGYRFAGTIESLNPAQSAGVARISGRQERRR